MFAGRSATTPAADTPARAAGLYHHQTVCPLCDHAFARAGVLKAARREVRFDTDLHVWYDGPDPDHYLVIVCPRCWFAAFPKDFHIRQAAAKADLVTRPKLRQMMTQLGPDFDFTQPRPMAAVQCSLILALHWYRWRGDKYLNREAEVWLRLAWLEREAGAGREAAEQDYLERAFRVLIQHYPEAERAATAWEQRVPYLIVELELRLGKEEELRHWGALWFDLRDLAKCHPADTLLQERLQDLQRIRSDGGLSIRTA